ncbi:hypothetical protein [Bacillus mesophilum]|uniref:Tape measure protein n=1 Tax=Bacillus mesophilum TaxID=1071718 RepID=A0A7V7UWI8_9BACI|nr:hypothetical protein [Bacillus mesophilum]KAB2334256.1 hypothetical protein F7732_09300 [Bacillus mesophilum]
MASRIKGITVEIGGDTVGLESALRDVNKRTKEVQTELKDVERLLKFDPNNVDLLAQRQQLLTDAIQSSTDKLNQLRTAQSQVEQQFQSGQIGADQYRAFQRELLAAEQQVNRFETALQDMQTEQQQVGERTRQMSALFDATGTSVEDYANVIGTRLVRAIQDGTATSRDLEYAFQRIGRNAIGANGDIERLRASLQTINTGGSIQDIRRDMQQLQAEAEQTSESVDGIGDSLAGVAGALAAGGGIGASIEQALDVSSLNTKIDISMDIDESSRDAVKESVRGVVAVIGEEEAALEGVRRQWALNKDASDEANAAVIDSAAAITKAYAAVDFTELIQEGNEVAAALKLSNEEAMGLINSLLKAGFPPEQLDTIAEYGQQMKDIGFSTAEIQSIFEAGINTKTWNIDNLNDGVKEARLQMATFGLEIPAALQPLLDKAGMSQKQFQEWGKAVAAGGEEGSQAMSDVAAWLDTIDNKELKNELATKVFGTKWEDQGDNMIAVFRGLEDAVDKTDENLIGMQETIDKVDADPATRIAQAMQDIRAASEPALRIIADIIGKIAGWISENPKLTATIIGVVTGIGIMVGTIMALAPIIFTLQAGVAALGITMGTLIGIISGVAVGIPLLIAAGVALITNWESIAQLASSVWSGVQNIVTKALSAIQEAFSDISKSDFMNTMIEKVTSAFSNFGSTVMGILQGDFSQLGEFFKMILPTLIGFMVGGIPGLIISASRFLPAIVEGIEGNKGVLIESINGIVASITEFLEVGLPQLVGAGLEIVINLIEGIISALPMVIEAGVSLLNSIIEGIGLVLPMIVDLSLQIITSLVTTIVEALPQVIEAGIGILNAVIEGIVSVLPLLLGAALLLITSVAGTLIENLPTIVSAGVDILTALIEGVVSILPSLVTMAVNLIITIASTLIKNLPKIISAGVDVLMALIDGIVQILPTLITTAVNLVVQIAGAIIKNLPKILSAGKDILKALINGIVSIVGTLLSTLAREIVNPILRTFKNIDLVQIGKDIIRGLINGVAGSASAVYNKIAEIANNIKKKFTGLFDIHSPSRVFAGYGENLNEGLIKGIQATSSKLNKAVDNVYGSLSSSVSGMTNIKADREARTMAAQSSNQPIMLNINPAPVYLDNGMFVGQIDFDMMDDGFGTRLNGRMIVNGVKK